MRLNGQHVAASLGSVAGLGTAYELEAMAGGKPGDTVADATQKWWVFPRDGDRPSAVLILSPTAHPERMSHTAATQIRILARLAERTGSVVLTPLRTGEWEGRSFALFPFHPPVNTGAWRENWYRWRLRRPMFTWLTHVAAESVEKVDEPTLEEHFVQPLERLAADEKLDGKLRRGAEQGLRRIERGKWRPRCVTAHNDLWLGNVLSAPNSLTGGYGFFIIDWGCATPRGLPFYDLVHVAESLRVTPRRLRSEVHEHCRLLHCQPGDAVGYLLARLGGLQGEGHDLASQRAVETAYRCITLLRSALSDLLPEGRRTRAAEGSAEPVRRPSVP